MGEDLTPATHPTSDESDQLTETYASEDSPVDRYFVGIESPSAVAQIDRHASAIVSKFDTDAFGSAVVCEATADDIAALESCSKVGFVIQDRPRYPVVVG